MLETGNSVGNVAQVLAREEDRGYRTDGADGEHVVPELGDGVDEARLQHELVLGHHLAPGGIVHQARGHPQVDLRPLCDLDLDQLADVDRAAGAGGDLDGQVGAVREGTKAVAVAAVETDLVEQLVAGSGS